ncbi:MAG: tetratricopeptide repeat protein [Gammaproteobacteria bacterium]|nr:tetratricopeptide repeat protein [Gammaproteobacteria bacterium]
MKIISLNITFVFTLALLFLVSACQQAPKEQSADWSTSTGEVRPGPKTGKAVLALLSKARQASNAGSLAAAESHLERALRIEPRNPTLWLYMAKLRLYAEKSKEAINLAKKALALSSSGREHESLRADCWRVIAYAYQKQGNLEQARIAEDKAKSISD